jgi:(p)ppGpp synthase/HD superfamily hydrolase
VSQATTVQEGLSLNSQLRSAAQGMGPLVVPFDNLAELGPAVPTTLWTTTPGFPERHIILARALRDISSVLAAGAELQGRVKSMHSILSKMRTGRLRLGQVLDAVGLRVIVPTTPDCYRLVDRIHRRFEIMEGEFDDYIRHPKPRGYRSLHTTILLSGGHPVEVQVRTPWMHRLAERGEAAHHEYKRRLRGSLAAQ